MTLPKIVSLFSGAGGLDLGFQHAGYEIAFAVDNSEWAVRTYRLNFPKTHSIVADLVELGPQGLVEILDEILIEGERIGVIGGPPCQGFSRANTTAAQDDPRNKLPLHYLEIVELLQSKYDVEFVLFENVPGIRAIKHKVVFDEVLFKLSSIGLTDSVMDVCAQDYGVPQVRKRVIVSAFKSRQCVNAFVPRRNETNCPTVRDTIGNLPEPAFYCRNINRGEFPHHPNHWTMTPRSKRFFDPDYDFKGTRSFRKLSWDKPSPTVAYGHREIHVHPSGSRRLSIYEAMRLQGFPHSFVILGSLSAQVDQVSNAVPPPVALELARAASRALSVQTIDDRDVRVG